MDLPDPLEMLTKGWTANRRRVDITIAALSAMAAFVKSQTPGKVRNGYAVNAWKILSETAGSGMPDAIVIPSKVLIDEGFTATGSEDPAVRAAATPAILKARKLGLGQARQ
jgi:hypothetical protein